MSGFVGSRAKKKQRNIIMFLCFIILIGIFYYIYPKIQYISAQEYRHPQSSAKLQMQYNLGWLRQGRLLIGQGRMQTLIRPSIPQKGPQIVRWPTL